MRTALFGGTFDPIHWGHLLLAESARAVFHLDRVIFVPTGVPPHKSPAAASARHRLKMVRLATASNPKFEVSDWEVRQNRRVYTVETLKHFRSRSPRSKLFILGSDMLKTLPTWKDSAALRRKCVFLAAERPGLPWTGLPAVLRRSARNIPWPATALASHEIRSRVRRGQSIRYQVPDAVEAYIRKHCIYS